MAMVMVYWFRFLDWFESYLRTVKRRHKYERLMGENWVALTRPGRCYSRVCRARSVEGDRYFVRRAPGWEWFCPNCKSYSIITADSMVEVLAHWRQLCEKTAAAGHRIPNKPEQHSAGCPECRYRPGDPE